MTAYLQLIDTHTIAPRYDITPLFADPEGFKGLVDDLLKQIGSTEFDLVAGIDALGFVLGTALAVRCHRGFLAVRKGGKLPVAGIQSVSFVDYTDTEKSLEIRTDQIADGTRVLVVDEWVDTGAQAKAAVHLIEQQGGVVAGIVTINMNKHEGTEPLWSAYPVFEVGRPQPE